MLHALAPELRKLTAQADSANACAYKASVLVSSPAWQVKCVCPADQPACNPSCTMDAPQCLTQHQLALVLPAVCNVLLWCDMCQVYDVTSYLDDHPGGSDSILQNAGVDCTDEFMGVHSQVSRRMIQGLHTDPAFSQTAAEWHGGCAQRSDLHNGCLPMQQKLTFKVLDCTAPQTHSAQKLTAGLSQHCGLLMPHSSCIAVESAGAAMLLQGAVTCAVSKSCSDCHLGFQVDHFAYLSTACCFAIFHLQEAKELLEKFVIGTVKAGAAKAAKQAPPPISVTDLAAAAAADPSKAKVRPCTALLCACWRLCFQQTCWL